MIVVIEGISAAGKTTWCRAHWPAFVREAPPPAEAPDRASTPAAAARYWAERNAQRWRAAQAREAIDGIAVCDSDPFKLHYVWSLWRIR